MAFNRLIYDECATRTEIRLNTSLFDSFMDVNRFVHVDPCRHDVGLVGAKSGVSAIAPPATPLVDIGGIRGDMVALENDLRGQTRPATRCPEYDYLPQAGVTASRELWKPVAHPVIRTDAPVHVGTCQMVPTRPLAAKRV